MDDRENERDHRAANLPRARRLVLGPQSLENADSKFSSRSLQTRRLPAPRLFAAKPAAVPHPRPRKQLARRFGHEHTGSARDQERATRRVLVDLGAGESRADLETSG